MSAALMDDTSTWSSTQNLASRRYRESAPWHGEAPVHFFPAGEATNVGPFKYEPSGFSFNSVPGVALGVTPPSAIRAQAQRVRDFVEAIKSGASLADDMVAADEIERPSLEIWRFALLKVLPYASTIAAPLIHPLQLGGVSLEWHDFGLNIELRFRAVDDVFTVIEDARGELQEFYGHDVGLRQASRALGLFMRRQN